jgi:hypothetical protein
MIFSDPVAFAAAQQADLLTTSGVLDTPKLATRLKDDVLLPYHTVTEATQDAINDIAGTAIEITRQAFLDAPGWGQPECRRAVTRLLTKQGALQYLLDGSGYRLCFATLERTFTSPTMGTLDRRFPGMFLTNLDALKMNNLLRPYIEQFERQADKRGDLLRMEAEANPALAAEMATMVRDVVVAFERNLLRGLGLADGGTTNNPALPDGS